MIHCGIISVARETGVESTGFHLVIIVIITLAQYYTTQWNLHNTTETSRNAMETAQHNEISTMQQNQSYALWCGDFVVLYTTGHIKLWLQYKLKIKKALIITAF